MRGSRRGASTVEFNQVNWSSLKQLIPYLTAYKGRLLFAIACLIAAKVASVALPFMLKDIVDQLNTPQTSNTSTDLKIVVPLALLLAYGLVRFSNVIFGQLRDTIFGRITEGAMHRIGHSVFQHLHALDLAYHLNRRTGAVSTDIERGVSGISFLMRFMVFNIVPTFLEIAMIIVLLLLNYSIWFAVIVFLSVLTYVSFSVVATEWRTNFVREMNKAQAKTSTRAIDSLLNFETVKYFNNEAYEAERYDEDLEEWEKARRRNRLSMFGLNGGQALIIAISITASMILAGFHVQAGSMTIGDFVLINALMMQIFVPLNFLGFVYREMKGSMANIDALFALLKIKSKIIDIDNAKDLVVSDGLIEFSNVAFAYHPERKILNNVSFRVEPKQKLAVVGSSGAGKSTIMKLLFRFYDIDSGAIYIDGQDISKVSQNTLRQAISVVPQETVLFNTSIFDNIHYGNVNASESDVWEAIQMAYLDDFIAQLPDGADTQVGERGLKLSGGEKQRVAIARAILKKPSIMVFDEATSSLDSHAELSILQAMERVRGSYSSVVIAHRLSTIVDADQIIVLDKGEVVEQGTHLSLLKTEGLYAKLWAIQDNSYQEKLS